MITVLHELLPASGYQPGKGVSLATRTFRGFAFVWEVILSDNCDDSAARRNGDVIGQNFRSKNSLVYVKQKVEFPDHHGSL
jgi:hypothetical protein